MPRTAGSRWEPLGDGLTTLNIRIGILLLFTHVFIVWALIRGHSRALRHFFWSVMAGLMLAPLASRAGLVIANGSGDTNITTYERVLDYKRMVKSDDSTSYYFYFSAVPGVDESSMKISVRSRDFSAGAKGDLYHLTVGAGNLGTPWLLGLERVGTP